MLHQAQSDGALNLLEVSFHGTALRLVVPDAASGQMAIRRCLEAAGITVRALEQVEPSIEEIFVSTIGRVTASEMAA